MASSESSCPTSIDAASRTSPATCGVATSGGFVGTIGSGEPPVTGVGCIKGCGALLRTIIDTMNKLTTALLSSCILLVGASAMAQDAMKKDDMGKDAMSSGAMAKDSMAKDHMKKPMAKDAMGKDHMAKDAMGKDPMGKGAMGKDAMGKDEMSK